MKRGLFARVWVVGLPLCFLGGWTSPHATAQADQSAEAQLVGKARTLEMRGNASLAIQAWQQVLDVDPNQPDALAGMAKAYKLEGHPGQADEFLNRLRRVRSGDPAIRQIESMGKANDQSAKVADAGRLAQAGQYGQAMAIQREVYGTSPPPGTPALSYYETEAATEEGRPHAIAGLRALMDQYPQELRYRIALGKVLTYNPRTRAEGRKLLEGSPNDFDAQQALQQAHDWEKPGASPATKPHPGVIAGVQPLARVPSSGMQLPMPERPVRRSVSPPEGGVWDASQQAGSSAELRAAYAALNSGRLQQAETLFQSTLDRRPRDAKAASGLGYVRMKQSNFGPAIAFFERAEENGDRSRGLEQALNDSRFFYIMQTATAALTGNNLPVAEQEFREALKKRPDDPQALEGLGGTLLKAQQNERAVEVFTIFVRAAPANSAAWRGLLLAEYGAGRFGEALATDRRMPARVKASLIGDPDYLRTLASTYLALGREADAQRVLREAMNLPFPPNGTGLKAGVELQYAALLSTANRKEQAISLYKQVLLTEPKNVNAWVGLVQNEHLLGQDTAAYESIRAMPSEVYAGAMQEVGFETSAASVFEALGHDDLALKVLEQLVARERAESKQPFAPARVQLAGLYVKLGQPVRAYPLYKALIEGNPNNADAWAGLLGALHATGHDQDAMAQLQAIPADVRRDLENNLAYLQTVGSIYASLGDPQVALQFFARVQQRYAATHVQPPAEFQVQESWLLYNAGNDQILLQHLLMLGGRKDLSDTQRRTLQTIWTNFAVRRAGQASAAGNYHLALAILNAAAQSFPDNRDVQRALAGGYAAAGAPKEAVAIFRTQEMTNAPAEDYRSAAGAALAANDLRHAEVWLRFGLEQYPRDSQMMILAAKFEAQRGDMKRAAEYYRAALAVMPPGSPETQLASELAKPVPRTMAGMPARTERQDLATLLAQPDPSGSPQRQPVQPYLPSYTGETGGAGAASGPDTSGYSPIVPRPRQLPAPANSGGQKPALKDYQPQSRAEPIAKPLQREEKASTVREVHLHADKTVEQKYGPYLAFDPSAGTPHFVGSRTRLGDGLVTSPGAVTTAAFASGIARVRDGHGPVLYAVRYLQGQQPQSPAAVPMFPPRPNPTKQETLNGVQVVPFLTTAEQTKKAPVRRQAASHLPSADVQRQAEAIHLNQTGAAESLTGVGHPPAENLHAPLAATLRDAQYTPRPEQTSQPGTGAQQYPQQTSPQRGVGAQQYPQPRKVGKTPDSGKHSMHRKQPAKPLHAESISPEPAPAEPELPVTVGPAGQQAPPMQYPIPGQAAASYPLGQTPSDYELQERTLPPLHGYYDPRAEPRHMPTEREVAELGLAQIVGGFSSWAGGSALGRYRSGVAGVDRLTALKVPIEASLVINDNFRLSIMPQAVFLNSGQLNVADGRLGAGPILGTYLASAPVNPSQQYANGIGVEAQLAASTFAVAVGSTPYEFPVINLVGRGRWRPANGHLTLYGGRDAVEETQLSYAGLSDPGTAATNYSGNVWGGVVQSGGGVRFDYGDEHSGVYVQGGGATLTGHHVLQNQKYDGMMGAYVRVKNWPETGALNIGGMFYGMHFTYNERGETYGLGGYFSPEIYFLASVPISFQGHYGTELHYSARGSLGVQTFQEDNQTYFPLDPGLLAVAGCTNQQLINHACGLPVSSNTGLNFSFESEVSYRATEHWFVGALLSANNTNNYETVAGGFFARYTFRQQSAAPDYPTGLFPLQGLRPMRVP